MHWLPKDSKVCRKEAIGSIISGLIIILPTLISGDPDPYLGYFVLIALGVLGYGAFQLYYSRILGQREEKSLREEIERRMPGLL